MKPVKEKLTNLICALGTTQANIEILLTRRYVPKKWMRQILLLQREIVKEIEKLKNEQI